MHLCSAEKNKRFHVSNMALTLNAPRVEERGECPQTGGRLSEQEAEGG